MARLWSSGFELNTNTANVEWTNTAGTPSIQTGTVRSGTYAGNLASLSSGTAKGWLYHYDAGGTGTYFLRFYFRVATVPIAENTFVKFANTTSSLTASAAYYMTIDSLGVLRLYSDVGQVGSASSALSTNTWYRIEMKVRRTNTSNTIVRALIDGSEFAGTDTDTSSTLAKSFVLGGNLRSELLTVGDWFFDDVAINDDSGSFQNTYPGEGEIIHLRPNAAGDNEAWIDGTTGSPNTYQDVDEVTPDNATTSIHINSPSANQTSDFNIDATPAALASDDTINCVQVGYRAIGDNTGTAVTYVLRIKATSGGTVEESAQLATNTTSYWTNSRTAPRNYQLTLYDLPGASTTAWTKTELDTAQIGVKIGTADGLDDADVSTLWLLVDHKPAAAPPATGAPQRMLMGLGT